jgi:CshA-type fibril repeat protein
MAPLPVPTSISRGLAVVAVAAMTATLGALPADAAVGGLAAGAPPDPSFTDSLGQDFWLAFPTNLGGSTLTLYISGADAGTGTVAVPGEAMSEDFTVTPGEVTAVPIPATYQITQADGIQDDGIHVTSSTDVAVYGVNQLNSTSGAFVGLPVDSLGQRYRALGYEGLGGSLPSQLTVVGTANDTTVTITPKTSVGSHAADVPYTVDLDAGQVYQVQEFHDVTGTVVESSAPVAVFGGAECTDIPVGFSACDHLVQQLTPTSAWGTDFLTVRFANRLKGDTYRVLANEDDTEVSVNGDSVATLGAGEFWEGVLPADATGTGSEGVSIHSSKPTLVAQYGNSSSYDGSTGDPMMMLVPPAGQYLDSYTLAAPDVSGYAPYASLVVPTDDVDSIVFDGDTLPAEDFAPIAGSDYSGAQLTLTSGTHNLSGPNPFSVQVYEWGSYDGFGFPGGMAMKRIYNDPQDPLTANNLTSTGTAPDAQQATVTVPEGGTVTLLDGDEETNEIDVDGVGSYVLDPETGIITFTPAHGYSGTPAGVTYRVTDGEEGVVTATYTPTVNPPAAPSPDDLSSTGTGTQPQSATADIPAEGSITLLDGDDETNEVVVDGVGTYLLDPETGVITFAPAPGYVGTADGVTYQVTDLYGQTATAVYSPTVELPAAPTANPLTSTGGAGAQQSVTVSVPSGGSAGLVDGEDGVNELTVDGEGVYAINATTGVLTFDPADGFTGAGAGVTYEVTDAYGQSAQSTYVPTVAVNAPKPRFKVKTDKNEFAMPKRGGAVQAVCWMLRGREDRCTIQLTARINGERTVIGSGHAGTTSGTHGHRINVTVHLNKVGRALLAARKHGHKAVLRASGRVEHTRNWLTAKHQIHLSRR